MKCNYCGSENTKLAGGCYVCLDCNKGFRLGITLIEIEPDSIGYQEKIKTISANETPFRIINDSK